MNFSNELNLGWVTPIRTASRSCHSIQKRLNFDVYGTHLFEIDSYKENFYIIFNVRNPLHRLVSIFKLWSIHNNRFVNFNKFVSSILDDSHRSIGYYDVYLEDILKKLPRKPDLYLRTEFFENDLKKCKLISEILIDTDFVNQYESEGQPWQSYYDEKLVDLVYEKLNFEFVTFGYNKNYWIDGNP